MVGIVLARKEIANRFGLTLQQFYERYERNR